MPRDLLEPILDGGVTNPHYFEGRLLTAAALREDQDAQRAHHRRLGRALGPGIVEGLWVTLEFAGSATLPPRVAVTAGLAINGEGDTLELPAREVVALARAASTPDQGTGLFRTCEPPAAQVEGPGAGFYVLVLSPASGFRGRAPFSGLSDPRAGSGCGSRWAVEGIRFRLLPLDPLAVTSLSAGIRELLENELLTAATEASRSKLRNVVAHLCLGTEPLTTFATDPFARETLTGGGTEAALTDYGALDDLRAAGTWKDCDVPLALLSWPLSGLEFADNWAVRRRPSPPMTADTWPTLTGGRRRAEPEAVLFQFQEHVAALQLRSASPTAIKAPTYFRYLPPAGLLPLFGPGRQRGLDAVGFFTGMTAREPVFLEGARLNAVVASSLTYPPVDLSSGEMLWRYLLRENRQESTLVPPFLLFAGGHVPFLGEAQFDLSHWNFSSFGPGVSG